MPTVTDYTPRNDPWIYRMVITVLGVVVIGSMAAAVYCSLAEKSLSQFIITIGSGGFGALVALLAPSPFQAGGTTTVTSSTIPMEVTK